MTKVIIIATILLLIVWMTRKPSKPNQELFPPVPPVQKEPEQVPIYENYRRVQQTLSRKSKVIEDQIREIGLGKQELAIGNLLLAIGNKHLEVKSDIIAADEKALDTTKREIEALMRWNAAELKEKAANLLLSEADLQAKANELTKNLGLLELKEGEIKLKGLQNEIMHRLNLLDIGDKRLDLKSKEIDLDKREVLLERFHNKNLEELGAIALGKKEIELGKQELEHLYKVKSFQLEVTLQNIKHMFTDLYLERKAFRNEQKESMLKLYQQELSNLDKYIRQMYEVRMNWLRIQEQQNNISYQKNRLELQNLYDKTMSKLEMLRLQKWDSQLALRENEVAMKNLALNFIGKSWLR